MESSPGLVDYSTMFFSDPQSVHKHNPRNDISSRLFSCRRLLRHALIPGWYLVFYERISATEKQSSVLACLRRIVSGALGSHVVS